MKGSFLTLLFLLIVPFASAISPEVALLVKRNEALTQGFTEFRLQPVNYSNQRLYIEHFPSMASSHIFLIGENGEIYPDPCFCPPEKIELFSKRYICLSPSSETAILFSVAKGTSRNIKGPGGFYLVYAIRKPLKKPGVLISPLTHFVLNENNEIISYSTLPLTRLSQKIRNLFRSEIEATMTKEGLPLEKHDNPF